MHQIVGSRKFSLLFAFLVGVLVASGWNKYLKYQLAQEAINASPIDFFQRAPARVPYVDPPPGINPVADAMRQRRPGAQLLELDRVLLNSEPVAAAWNHLFGVLRNDNTIPPDIRELLILRSAALNGATYEWAQHQPEAQLVGLTGDQLNEIRFSPAFLTPHLTLTPSQSAAMLFADWVTKGVYVPQPVYEGLKQFLTDRQMVEAVATVGGYNFLGRFVVALNVGGVMDVPVPTPG